MARAKGRVTESDRAKVEQSRELLALRLLVREHVEAWRLYFKETGGEPAALWTTFAALEKEVRRGTG